MVYVYNKDGIKLGEIALSYDEIDDEWHQYVIDISKHTGEIIIYFNDGNVDSTEDTESKYVFTDIKLY